MKTLSAANQANIANRHMNPAILFSIPGLSRQWSTGDTDGYDPGIIDISEVAQRIDKRGGIGHMSDFTVDLNKEPTQFIQDNDWVGEAVTLSIQFGTDAEIIITKATIDRWQYAGGVLRVFCKSNQELRRKELPDTLINTETYTGARIPNRYLNQPVPITIGDAYRPQGMLTDMRTGDLPVQPGGIGSRRRRSVPHRLRRQPVRLLLWPCPHAGCRRLLPHRYGRCCLEPDRWRAAHWIRDLRA